MAINSLAIEASSKWSIPTHEKIEFDSKKNPIKTFIKQSNKKKCSNTKSIAHHPWLFKCDRVTFNYNFATKNSGLIFHHNMFVFSLLNMCDTRIITKVSTRGKLHHHCRVPSEREAPTDQQCYNNKKFCFDINLIAIAFAVWIWQWRIIIFFRSVCSPIACDVVIIVATTTTTKIYVNMIWRCKEV